MDRLAYPSISVVIPARDERVTTLVELKYGLHKLFSEVLIVDDGSDPPLPNTVASFRHETSQGYGAAIKTGLLHASCPYILTMDGDGQHEVTDAFRLAGFLQRFPECVMVIGDRRLKERGVRLWGRKALNWTASFFAHRWISDLNSGMRLFERRVAEGYLPILSDRFSLTTSLTLSLLADGYPVDWLPIKVNPRTHGVTKVQLLSDGWRTLLLIVWIGLALNTRTVRKWLRPVWTPIRRLIHV